MHRSTQQLARRDTVTAEAQTGNPKKTKTGNPRKTILICHFSADRRNSLNYSSGRNSIQKIFNKVEELNYIFIYQKSNSTDYFKLHRYCSLLQPTSTSHHITNCSPYSLQTIHPLAYRGISSLQTVHPTYSLQGHLITSNCSPYSLQGHLITTNCSPYSLRGISSLQATEISSLT